MKPPVHFHVLPFTGLKLLMENVVVVDGVSSSQGEFVIRVFRAGEAERLFNFSNPDVSIEKVEENEEVEERPASDTRALVPSAHLGEAVMLLPMSGDARSVRDGNWMNQCVDAVGRSNAFRLMKVLSVRDSL